MTLFKIIRRTFLLRKNRVHFPTGLLVEKWLLYYYPILESQTAIPQINGETNLAFGNSFVNIISAYKEILKQEGQVYCVWTGKKVSTYDIDHLIPFSIWKNNDLWNLLPSDSKTNNQKRDKIPSPELIEKQKSLIVDYWEILNESQTQRFNKEIQIALLGNNSVNSWQETGIKQLQSS